MTDDYDPSRYRTFATSNLRSAVGGSPQMESYVDQAKDIIVQSIVANHGDTSHLAVQEDLDQNFLYQRFDESLRYPRFDFSVTDANQRAPSIAIHQFHGHRIRLEDYVATDNSFSGELVFESYDHFDGKYVPPITRATVGVPISGSF